jgi:hypothetical protein
VSASDRSKATIRIKKSRITKLGSTMARVKTGRKSSRNRALDAEAFLTTVGAGRTISTYKAKSYIFRHGMECGAVFWLIEYNGELKVHSSPLNVIIRE